jgi:hypothetical protein
MRYILACSVSLIKHFKDFLMAVRLLYSDRLLMNSRIAAAVKEAVALRGIAGRIKWAKLLYPSRRQSIRHLAMDSTTVRSPLPTPEPRVNEE